MSSGLTASRNF